MALTNPKEINESVQQFRETKFLNTLAELKAYTATPKRIFVSGYHSPQDDAFGGLYHELLPVGEYVEKGGVVVLVASGRYYKLKAKDIRVEYFGAVSDGSDSTEAIRAAYDAYDTIYIEDTFNLKNLSTFIKLRSNTSIRGRGKLIVDTDATMANIGNTPNGYLFKPVFGTYIGDNAVDNFVMKDVKFSIQAENASAIILVGATPSNILLNNVEIDGLGVDGRNKAANGIHMYKPFYCTIKDCKFTYLRNAGVRCIIPMYLTVKDSKFYYNGVDKQYPFTTPGTAVEGIDYWAVWSISCASSYGGQYLNNRIKYSGGAGIGLRGGGSPCGKNLIDSNYLEHIGKGGIGIGINTGGSGGSFDNTVSNNHILGFQERWTDTGINCNNRGSGDTYNIKIIDNVINMVHPDDVVGLYPNHVSGANSSVCCMIAANLSTKMIYNVTFTGNEISNAQSQGLSGGYLANSDISFNVFKNCSRQDIAPYNMALTSIYACNISNNLFRNTHDSGVTVTTGYAMYISGQDVKIERNTVINEDGYQAEYNFRINQMLSGLKEGLDATIPSPGGSVVVCVNNNSVGGVRNAAGRDYYVNSLHANIIAEGHGYKANGTFARGAGRHFNGVQEFVSNISPEGYLEAGDGDMCRCNSLTASLKGIWIKTTATGTTGWKRLAFEVV